MRFIMFSSLLTNKVSTLSPFSMAAGLLITTLLCQTAFAEESATSESATAASASRFVLQIGTFEVEADAQSWVTKLKSAGVPAYLDHKTRPDGSSAVLLRAGPFPDRGSAEAALIKVRKVGLGGGTGSTNARNSTNDPAMDSQATPPRLRYSGLVYKYPKGESESRLLAAIPDLQCRNFDGTRLCTLKASPFQQALISGLPGACLLGHDIMIVFKHARLDSVSCDLAPMVASDIYDINNNKFGNPLMESHQISSMKITTAQWAIGKDSLELAVYTGTDMYGNPILSSQVTIRASTEPQGSPSR
jgi:hypothetical protein